LRKITSQLLKDRKRVTVLSPQDCLPCPCALHCHTLPVVSLPAAWLLGLVLGLGSPPSGLSSSPYTLVMLHLTTPTHTHSSQVSAIIHCTSLTCLRSHLYPQGVFSRPHGCFGDRAGRAYTTQNLGRTSNLGPVEVL
jgi:hypothetical protein